MASTTTQITSIPATPAQNKVLSTRELVEEIFTYLPLATLHTLLLVSHTFHNLIKTSSAIHRSPTMTMLPSRLRELPIPTNAIFAAEPFDIYLDFDNSLAFPGTKKNFLSIAAPSSMKSEEGVVVVWYEEKEGLVQGFPVLDSRLDRRRLVIRPLGQGVDELWRKVRLVGDAKGVALVLRDKQDCGSRASLKGNVTLGEIYDQLCRAAGYLEPEQGGEKAWGAVSSWNSFMETEMQAEAMARHVDDESDDYYEDDSEDSYDGYEDDGRFEDNLSRRDEIKVSW